MARTAAALLLSLTAFSASAAERAPAVSVSADGQALEIKRAGDVAATRVAVVDRCRPEAPAGTAGSRIRHFAVGRTYVHVTWGKHCAARVVLKTLDVDCVGCD